MQKRWSVKVCNIAFYLGTTLISFGISLNQQKYRISKDSDQHVTELKIKTTEGDANELYRIL